MVLDMNTLITGSTGFVGARLLSAFQNEGRHYYTIDRNFQISDARGSLVGDVHDIKFKNFFDNILHLASYLSSGSTTSDTENLINSNIGYGSKILSCSIVRQGGIFIDFGSFAELHTSNQHKINYLYTETKKGFENIAKYFCIIQKLHYTKIIPYTLYSEKDQKTKLIDLIFESFKNQKVLDLSSGRQILDFVHLDDLINLIMLTIDVKSYESLNFRKIECGTGNGTSIHQLVRMLEEISGQQSKINWNTNKDRPFDVYHAVADTSVAREYLGWQPNKTLYTAMKDRWNGY